jgi:hypothetical protein
VIIGPLWAQKNYTLPDWAYTKAPSKASEETKSAFEITNQIENAYHIFSNSTQISTLPSRLTPLLNFASKEQKKQIHYLLGQTYIVLGKPREANLHLTLAQKNNSKQELPYKISQWNLFLLPEISHKLRVGTQTSDRVIDYQNTPSGQIFYTTASQDFFYWDPSTKNPKFIQHLPSHQLLAIKDSEHPFFINKQENTFMKYNTKQQVPFWTYLIEDTLISVNYIHPSLQILQTNESFVALQDGQVRWKKTYSGNCSLKMSQIKNNSLILCTHKSFFINQITGITKDFNLSNENFNSLIFNQYLILYNSQKIILYKNEQKIWEKEILGLKQVQIHQGFIYILNSGELLKINPKNAKEVFRKTLYAKQIFSHSEHLFILGSHNQLGNIDVETMDSTVLIQPNWIFYNNNSKYSFYSFHPTQLLHFNRSENSFQIIDLDQSFSIPAFHRNWKNTPFWKNLEPFHPKLEPSKFSVPNQWINASQKPRAPSSISFIKNTLDAHKVEQLPQGTSQANISHNNQFIGYIDPINQSIKFIHNQIDSYRERFSLHTFPGPWKEISSVGQESFYALKLNGDAYKITPGAPIPDKPFDSKVQHVFSSSTKHGFYQKNNKLAFRIEDFSKKQSKTELIQQQITSYTTSSDLVTFKNNKQETFQLDFSNKNTVLQKLDISPNTTLLCTQKNSLWSASQKKLQLTLDGQIKNIDFNHSILSFSCSSNQAWLSLGNGDIVEVTLNENTLQSSLITHFNTPVFTAPIKMENKLWIAHQNSLYSSVPNQDIRLFKTLPSTISRLFTSPKHIKVLTLDGFYIIWDFPL